MSQIKGLRQKRDGFFRLGIGIDCDTNKELFPDVTDNEIKECRGFVKDMMLFAKQCVQETVREKGYEFVSTGKEKQRELNQAFQDYKRSVDLHCVNLRLTPKSIEIEPLQEDEEPIELPEEIERGYIELEPMTPEEQAKYEEYKRQRKERVYKKFGYNPALDTRIKRPKIKTDSKWQGEILDDNLDEIRY